MSSDTELQLGHLRDGYPSLAAWIARDPDNEAFVFRRFDKLGARCMLHLQAKLIDLERKIDRQDEQARRSADREARMSSRSWETLMEHATDMNRKEKDRVETLEQLSVVLKEYYELLNLQSQTLGLRKPSDRVLTTFRDFLKGASFRDESGKPQPLPLIGGAAQGFLDEKRDLLMLAAPVEEDHLSLFLRNYWPFQKRKAQDPLDRTTIYKNSHIVRTVSALNMLLAALLLIGAIVNLYYVTSPKAKLGLVAMYTALFALSVALLTTAKRAEVFAAAAAYAAVLVGTYQTFCTEDEVD